ncbi:hypothetical protein H8S33_11460 [Ornithinibacillus sp. BX22]|uniref:Uncharacterized protein n=1 Tax=Ornithinibacillus hominis TaxID=2763055 RepID=A0A923L6K6_9BACI|nr:hypothetical protein [Ornithinibacillus hominis]MBC5637423.1 hypothetical protein [Ornithinibacillus hominis]
MINSAKIVRAISILCGALITIGVISFLYGFFGSGYAWLTGIGLGVVMGGVFIFIMGIFLVATEEVVEKNKQNHPHNKEEALS